MGSVDEHATGRRQNYSAELGAVSRLGRVPRLAPEHARTLPASMHCYAIGLGRG